MIGTEEGHKDGCGVVVKLQELGAKMRENMPEKGIGHELCECRG